MLVLNWNNARTHIVISGSRPKEARHYRGFVALEVQVAQKKEELIQQLSKSTSDGESRR